MEPGAQRMWMAQWRRATEALAEQRRCELVALTEPQALAAAEALLALVSLLNTSAGRRETSGLVQQQSLLHRRPPPA